MVGRIVKNGSNVDDAILRLWNPAQLDVLTRQRASNGSAELCVQVFIEVILTSIQDKAHAKKSKP